MHQKAIDLYALLAYNNYMNTLQTDPLLPATLKTIHKYLHTKIPW